MKSLSSVVLLCFMITGCMRTSIFNEIYPYQGNWESTYVYKSGYTNMFFLPVAIKLVRHTLKINTDGTYEQTVSLVYSDDTTSRSFYSGLYTYTDTEITLQATEGISETQLIAPNRLPEAETYIRKKKTLTSKEVYYAESPERNEQNELKYPIVLTFFKK